MEAEKQEVNKTPEEKLAIAKIQVMMEDSFGLLSNSESSPALQDRTIGTIKPPLCSVL